MADQLQLRGGTTTEHSTFTGALREVTVDTTKKTLVVHDAATVGGIPVAREDLSNVSEANIVAAVPAGSTTAAGLLQLTDSTSSTSTTTAATPAAVKSAYDLANGALPKSGGTMTGAITFAAGQTISGYLAPVDIGVTVQGYDADTAKTDVAQTFTAQQTFRELKETVFTLGTTGSIALDPANGSIQKSVLTGAPTFTDSLEAGQTIVLMLEGGASYSVTWPTITWVTSAGNAAPTLTAKDTLVLWKVSTTLYGAYVGSYV